MVKRMIKFVGLVGCITLCIAGMALVDAGRYELVGMCFVLAFVCRLVGD